MITFPCPGCGCEGTVSYEELQGGWSRGWLVETIRPCPTCDGRGEIEASQLVALELPMLIEMLGDKTVSADAFADIVVHQATKTGVDPIGTYIEEWMTLPETLRVRIESRIESHFEIARDWRAY